MPIPILAAVGVAQQLISLLKSHGSNSASNAQATSYAPQDVRGQYPHQKSIANMVAHLQSAIDLAVKTGKLTGDQAIQMRGKLDFVTQTLNKTQTGSGGQLTSDDLQQIRTKFQEVRNQLFAALYPQGIPSSLGSGGIGYNLFKTMSASQNGMIDKSQLSNFISTLL